MSKVALKPNPIALGLEDREMDSYHQTKTPGDGRNFRISSKLQPLRLL